jgi:hypothetical protein
MQPPFLLACSDVGGVEGKEHMDRVSSYSFALGLENSESRFQIPEFRHDE